MSDMIFESRPLLFLMKGYGPSSPVASHDKSRLRVALGILLKQKSDFCSLAISSEYRHLFIRYLEFWIFETECFPSNCELIGISNF